MIVLWKRRKQGEDRSHDSPGLSPVVDEPGSQRNRQSELEQNEIEMQVNPTLHAELSPNEMKTNIAYGSISSGQQRSTDVTPVGVEYSDMQSNIAYGCGALDQQRSTDVTPGGVEYSDMQSNIAYGCVASDQCHDTDEHSSEVSTL